MLALSVLLGLSTASAIDILVIDGEPSYSSALAVAAQLEDSTAFAYTVTVLEPGDVTSVTDLASYDAILMGDSGHSDSALFDSTFIGILVDYQDVYGGGIITGSWMAYTYTSAIDEISPTSGRNSSGYCVGPTTLTVSAHEITAGLPASFTDSSTYTEAPGSIRSGADVPVTAGCNGNGAAITYQTSAGARQVYMGILYFGEGASYANAGLRSGDADTLLEQAVAWVAGCADNDSDGVNGCADDCDDSNPDVYPGAEELCDGVDNDCDEVLSTEEADLDSDGVVACEGDCDDDDPDTYPGAPELCDAIDNDCDGGVPNDEIDLDGDGYAACEGDCADGDHTISPGAEEVCDGVDNDCDLSADEGLETTTVYTDSDGDGYGDDATATESCELPPGTVTTAGDCDDTDASANPDGEEIAGNGIDEDCDGADLADTGAGGKDDEGLSCAYASPRGLSFLAVMGVLVAARRRRLPEP